MTNSVGLVYSVHALTDGYDPCVTDDLAQWLQIAVVLVRRIEAASRWEWCPSQSRTGSTELMSGLYAGNGATRGQGRCCSICAARARISDSLPGGAAICTASGVPEP